MPSSQRIAAITHVAGDLSALLSVLTDIKDHEIKRIWCLGDTCANSTESADCVDLVTRHCEIVLAGASEDLLRKEARDLQSPTIEVVRSLQSHLGPERLRLLESLKFDQLTEEVELTHGAFFDRAHGWFMGIDTLRAQFDAMRRPLLIYGGQSPQRCIHVVNGRIVVNPPREEEPLLLPASNANDPYIISPPSVTDAHGPGWLELCIEPSNRCAIWRRTPPVARLAKRLVPLRSA